MALAVTVTRAMPSDIGMTAIVPSTTDTLAVDSLSDSAAYETVTSAAAANSADPISSKSSPGFRPWSPITASFAAMRAAWMSSSDFARTSLGVVSSMPARSSSRPSAARAALSSMSISMPTSWSLPMLKACASGPWPTHATLTVPSTDTKCIERAVLPTLESAAR